MPPSKDPLYPPVGLFYAVRLGTQPVDDDTRFMEVSGLSAEMDTVDVTEGGENRFKHRLPAGAKHQNLVLQRGLTLSSLPFFQWCQKTVMNNLSEPITLQTVQVVLLNDQAKPLKTWTLMNAWPVKWSVSEFNSMNSKVVIETLELAYQYFKLS